MKIGFVILCYGKSDMVLECINYIENINNLENVQILVVDNCSPDGTGEIVRNKTKQLSNVEVYLNDKNLGFAKGNNIGYLECVEKYKCDVVVVLNSDVFIDDENFIIKLKNIIEQEPEISIIAPDIIEDGFKHKNPLSVNRNDMEDVKMYIRTIVLDAISNFLLHLHIDYFRIKKKNDKANYNANQIQEEQYDIVPHGACIIFCKPWTIKEKRAFYFGTFLFCEEHFLYAYATQKNYKIAYKPDLKVRHLGDGSINANSENERKKRIFVNHNQRKSFQRFLKVRKKIVTEWNKEY